jgi:hypothetical protein
VTKNYYCPTLQYKKLLKVSLSTHLSLHVPRKTLTSGWRRSCIMETRRSVFTRPGKKVGHPQRCSLFSLHHCTSNSSINSPTTATASHLRLQQHVTSPTTAAARHLTHHCNSSSPHPPLQQLVTLTHHCNSFSPHPPLQQLLTSPTTATVLHCNRQFVTSFFR